MLPTSPSLMMRLFAAYLTGYMQSTISRIWVISKFFMKSLSNMADLMSSRDLQEIKEREKKFIDLKKLNKKCCLSGKQSRQK